MRARKVEEASPGMAFRSAFFYRAYNQFSINHDIFLLMFRMQQIHANAWKRLIREIRSDMRIRSISSPRVVFRFAPSSIDYQVLYRCT